METALSHCPELSTLTLGLTSVLGSDGSTVTPVSLGLLHATTHAGGGVLSRAAGRGLRSSGAGPRAGSSAGYPPQVGVVPGQVFCCYEMRSWGWR